MTTWTVIRVFSADPFWAVCLNGKPIIYFDSRIAAKSYVKRQYRMRFGF